MGCSSVGKESTCNAGDLVQFLGWEDLLEKDRLPTPRFLGCPGGLAGKESACNAGDLVQFLGREDLLEKG